MYGGLDRSARQALRLAVRLAVECRHLRPHRRQIEESSEMESEGFSGRSPAIHRMSESSCSCHSPCQSTSASPATTRAGNGCLQALLCSADEAAKCKVPNSGISRESEAVLLDLL